MATKNSSSQEPNLENDPKAKIEEILKILYRLSQKVLPPDTLARRDRSYDPELNMPNTTILDPVSIPLPVFHVPDDSKNVFFNLQHNLRLIKEGVVRVQRHREDVADAVRKQLAPLEKLLRKVSASESPLTTSMKKSLEDINKKMFNTMIQVPLLPNNFRLLKISNSKDEWFEDEGWFEDDYRLSPEDLHERLAVLRHVREKIEKFRRTHLEICLLSFAVLPGNQEVNRTMLMYWWIGEGFLPEHVKPEDAVKDILKEFVEEKLIEPVENRRKLEPVSYKMVRSVHYSVARIWDEMGLTENNYEEEKKPIIISALNKVYLVEGSSSKPGATKMSAVGIGTVFNVSEMFPEFALTWFSESEEQPSQKKKTLLGGRPKPSYKSLKVLYLGRWERTPKRHIKVGNPKLMKYVKHMPKLRLLSFQGISNIETLDAAVCELRELIVLDLRACYNLEKLPEKIDSLKNLTYLDMTGCYMMDHMPKRMSWLDNLEVLKGFVVSDATDDEKVCLLAELKHLKKLRKLSITICKSSFGVFQLIQDIMDFKKLEILTVAWGVTYIGLEQESKFARVKTFKNLQNLSVPKTLKKLDLQCFPDAELPLWLKPQNLGGLEKLYIRGGRELTGFGKSPPETPTECNVKVLRLKFLPKLKVEWRELSQLYFPKLSFLEKYQCPLVSLCPTDGIGIWRKP